MKALIRISFVFVALASISNWSVADIGVTHQLKQERAEMLRGIDGLKSDSLNNQKEIDSLQNLVIDLDAKIMASYDETIARLAAKNRDFGSNTQSIVFLAMIATAAALFMFIILLSARRHILTTQNVGLRGFFKRLTTDFIGSVSHENAPNKSVLRVNVVVVISLILMSLSVLAFLLRTL